MEATTTPKAQVAPPPRLRERFEQEIAPALRERFGYSSPMEVPTIEKITLNMGIGEAKQDDKILDAATEQLGTIAGQRPNVRRARKSIAEVRGLDVTITTTANSDEEAFELLLALGMPFAQDGRPGQEATAEEEAEEERRHEEARQRAEAEQAALEQLKEENPEAYAKPVREEEGEEGEEGAEPGAEGGE